MWLVKVVGEILLSGSFLVLDELVDEQNLHPSGLQFAYVIQRLPEPVA